MIHLFATRVGARDTLHPYLRDWAGEMRPRLAVHLYEEALRWPPFGAGTFIFTDLERLNAYQMEVVRGLRDQLLAHHPHCRILNDPREVLLRLPLLNALHAAGINDFNAYPVDQLPKTHRMPVFLRSAADHSGSRTPLLEDQGSRDRALLGYVMSGLPVEQAILVEFCDTRDSGGIYRKYAAFRFGGRIIPAHVIFSREWVAKDGEPFDAAQREEEEDYVHTNPHREALLDIFERGHIQYGRIDYSLLNGRIQVWEINTNPILLKERAVYEEEAPQAIPLKETLAVTIRDCLRALDDVEAIPDVPPLRPSFKIVLRPPGEPSRDR